MSFTVRGFCPMGCGETLFLGADGYVTCRRDTCQAPDAASEILHTAETEHIVEFHDEHFDVQHPLRERLFDKRLFTCPLHEYLTALSGPPFRPGRYRALRDVSDRRRWTFEAAS